MANQTQTPEEQIDALTKENQALRADRDTAGKVVADLKLQLAGAQSEVKEFPTVTSGKDTYELISGSFTYKGKEVTIDTLKDDSKLVAELIKEGVQDLRKKVDK